MTLSEIRAAASPSATMSEIAGPRRRCRNPRCGAKLKRPADNPREAFCCAGCFEYYFRGHCLVCERPFKRKTERRRVCSRSKCRHEFQRHRARFLGARYPTSGLGHNGLGSAHSTGLKTRTLGGRPFHKVAGPGWSVDSLRLASLPPYLHLPSPRLIGRHSSPVNLLGGYHFPDAPIVIPVAGRLYPSWEVSA